MTIREISKGTTHNRNMLILRMLLKKPVKDVATRFALSPYAVYKIAYRHKKELKKMYLKMSKSV